MNNALVILQGFLVCIGLIVAIGPQNAFVLSQGLKREHVFLTALICMLTDTLLIALGVVGLGAIFNLHPLLIDIARWFGAAFLTIYGLLSFKAAWHPTVFRNGSLNQSIVSRKNIVMMLLGLGLLNPHAYLDAVVLIGLTKLNAVEQNVL